MPKKTERDKLIEVAAKVLSIEPKALHEALENALEISVLKRDLHLLGEMLKSERQQHDDEIKRLKQQVNVPGRKG